MGLNKSKGFTGPLQDHDGVIFLEGATPKRLHELAMDRFASYRIAKQKGQTEGLDPLIEASVRFETEAAKLATGITRPVLFRSAGWLAINAGHLVEALTLAQEGLKSEELPEWVALELNEVIDEVAKRLREDRGAVR